MRIDLRPVAAALLLLFCSTTAQQQASSIKQKVTRTEAKQLERFEGTIDRLREELKIPAVSATIIRNQKVLWARGFGFADIEKKTPATEHTPYHLASLTKTFASNIVMNLVGSGKVNLDDPVSKYGIILESNGVIRVRHIFSHTSEGNPGERFRYSGSRYSGLDNVIEKTTGSTFGELVVKNILDPLGMNETTPNAISALRVQPTDVGDSSSVEQVKTGLLSLFRAYNMGDVESIARLYSQGSTDFPTDGEFLERLNLQTLRRLVKAGYKFNFEVHNVGVAIHGTSAVATFYYRGTVTSPNGSIRFDGPWRSTLVWSKDPDGWKIVHAHYSPMTSSLLTEDIIERYQRILPSVAQPYRLDSANQVIKGVYPTYFGTAAGLISSVADLAKYDIALDEHKILDEKMQRLAWSPTISTNGDTLPYGLGWFTTNYHGIRLVWHYGWWDCNSSLFLKVPEQNLTFIALANTDNLSRSSSLGSGDVTSSPMGLEFLKQFVLPELQGGRPPDIDWNVSDARIKDEVGTLSEKPYGDLAGIQLLNQARILSSVGQAEKASKYFTIYAELFSKPLPHDLANATTIAHIADVTDNQDTTVEFTLKNAQTLRIFAVGEESSGQMVDYGWIEDAASAKVVWEMKGGTLKPAGGDEKNLMADTAVTLQAGTYKLRYKSDESHSYNHWNALPPEYDFWGIAVYAAH